MPRSAAVLKSDLLRVVIGRMDTKNIDLGLLVTLEALLAERNVTRAARRLNLSLPALSARLARLREALGDPLLIPARRGMVLTQRALELQHPLHEALEGVRRIIGERAPFDPATLQATLVIAASDYVQYALLARFSVALRAEAMALSMQLERGEVDLALATPEHAPAAMRQRRLYDEDYAVVARQNHPALQDGLSLNVFCTLDHVVVSPQGSGFAGPAAAAAQWPCPPRVS